jgi:hypothetical protein
MRDRILRKRDAEEMRHVPGEKNEIAPKSTRDPGFDFEAERDRLKIMTDEELKEHTERCEQAVTSPHQTADGVWHDLNRLQMAEGEARRRHGPGSSERA